MAAPSPKTGVTWMLISAVAFTAMGAIAKALTSSVPVATILIWRNSFSLLLILGILTVLGRLGALRTRQAGGHLTRATLGTLSLVCMLEAYARLDFALATTLAYTTPFWVILASALLLGERPNLRRTLAAVAGFGGVIIIIRPLPALSAGVVLALASVPFSAAYPSASCASCPPANSR